MCQDVRPALRSYLPSRPNFLSLSFTYHPILIDVVFTFAVDHQGIPANFFWDISVRFLSWECWDFWRRHDHFRRFPKKFEVFWRIPKSSKDVRSLPKAKLLRKRSSTKLEIARKVLSFIHFTHGFRSFRFGSELTYFWKLCQARRQQLTFFNQAWEFGPQAWAGVRSKFSTRRRESWQV